MDLVHPFGPYVPMAEKYEGHSLAAIGSRLEITRRVFGFQQNEFAERAGLATNTYNQYEKAKKRPSIENAMALCDAYNLTLDWIYRGDSSGLRYETADAIKALRQMDASDQPSHGSKPSAR